MNDELKGLIEFEKEQALANKKAKIILKLNNLQDTEMIDLLYDASQAGVEIQLITRGINCLIPKKPGLSDNITGISIVDRYLEHGRVYYFNHDGEEKIFLSSADWMVRNLHFRIEIAFPIYAEPLKKQVMDTLELQLNDNVKSRSINYLETNQYISNFHRKKIRSQIETYKYFKELHESSNEK